MLRCLTFALLTSCCAPFLQAQDLSIPEPDRIRIAEVYRLADVLQEQVWTGWNEAPFALLLITNTREYLVRHPHPGPSFARLSFDALLGSDVYGRERQFPTGMFASFPLDGTPTIVVGQPDATGLPSTRWVLTVMHEHFHQYQYSRPTYAQGLAALDLAGDDSTGMWMLNYAFPYDSTAVAAGYDEMASRAREALLARGTPSFDDAYAAFRTARENLRSLLSARDYRYLSVQLWQEGVSRYIEYRTARRAKDAYTPTPAFTALPDFVSFAETNRELQQRLLDELQTLSLESYRRVAFYAVGAAEALLLDEKAPGWHDRYFADMFSLDAYHPPR